MLVLRGRWALSVARRARVLAKAKAACPGVEWIDARWVHLVASDRELTAAERAQLEQMLDYGPSVEGAPAKSTNGVSHPPIVGEMRLDGPPVASTEPAKDSAIFYVAPRIGTTSPWSSKATDIAHVCGLAIDRIERALEYGMAGEHLDVRAIGAALSDRMTETVLVDEGELARVVAHRGEPRPLGHVALGDEPAKTLRAASDRLGLALADDEIAYLVDRYRELARDPTDVELMMFAQANSEHCRHKIFNADWYLAGERQEASPFQMIKRSTAAHPAGVLSAYKDNAAVVEGNTADRWFPDADGVYRPHGEPSHILGKVETHNHPTAISPFPGAATGSGGEIRDEGATGRGAKPKAGLVGFTVSDLRVPGALEPWEPRDADWIGRPDRIASALDIMIEGPVGGAAFNNEFGRPAIAGYFRTFEIGDRGFHKPVMLAGGIGAIRAGHVQKATVPDGAALIVLGGPAFLIGLGGGAASSLAQGASAADLDFASVQRDNAEIQRRCQEVIDRCWAMGDRNPILSIHDVGAGGLSNALPELVHDAGLGAKLELRAIPTGEPDLSPLELWCNEAQERYVLAIAPERVGEFAQLCERERAPWAQVGTATAGGRFTVADRRGGAPPVDIPLEVVLGKPPRMTRRADWVHPDRPPIDLDGVTVAEALDRVLGLPTVADKSFLVTIGDRTVGGLIARDPMIGRFQVPVADCALTLAGFETCVGEVMALGERPPVALLSAPASARLAIAEAITNLAGAPIGPIGNIKLSCNWMAAAGHPGEDARLYDAVKAASELAIALGIAIPVGKDSMSMRTVWRAKDAAPSLEATPGDPTIERAESTPESSDDKPHIGGPMGVAIAAVKSVVEKVVGEVRGHGQTKSSTGEATPSPESSISPESSSAPHREIPHVAGPIGAAVAAARSLASRVAATISRHAGTHADPETRAVVSPVTLVVTAFGPVDDVRKNVTPELRGDGRELYLVDLASGQGRLGASCLAQVYRQVGDYPPDLDDPARLATLFTAMQTLVAERRLGAYHDRSDGGLVVTALEMAFASGLGLELDTTRVHADPFSALFAEELGAIIELAADDVARARSLLGELPLIPIGRAVKGDRVRIVHRGATVVDATRTQLRKRWSHTTHQIAARRDDPTCAAEEHASRLDPEAPGLTAELAFDPAADIEAPMIARGARPRVAILREQGVNGQIEMAAAFTRAGFEAVDVHMTDLVAGRADLTDVRGVVACGGFSFGDVFGAGRGWAATFRYNARARDALAGLAARDGTFILGVCNGCQMIADIAGELPGAGTHWPRFVRNRSEQFESRLVLLRIDDTPSIFFTGMAGSRIPIATAHGEGRAELTAAALAALERDRLVAARFVDGRGAVATSYPANPNGSPGGVAALTSPDGRITVLMPHPERVFRTAQMSWHPPEWGEDSPWMRMFRNARVWVA
jgi:phosphoribosylformylglycinamidine synthase